MPLADWRHDGWAALPVRRVDILGDYEEPFTLQWAGSLAPFSAALQARGWRLPVAWDLRSSLEWLLPNATPAALPVLPHLDNGRAEALVMIKTGGDVPPGQRLILRLWPSGTVLSGGAGVQPLWIGTVVAERVEHLKPLASLVDERNNVNGALLVLKSSFPDAKLESRAPAVSVPDWSGAVLLGPP